mmetsp:Transcript_6730/g.13679  ORF Transcript_6730/g.13679 Transcript_6730/m.13679 type:complete len:199 (+) Transcript_6730:1885-2481(+)
MIKFAKAGTYDYIIVDTAPTGHTLRLLELPTFLEGFIGKIMTLKKQINLLLAPLRALFGSAELDSSVIDAERKLSDFRENLVELKKLLTSKSRFEFITVAIPTGMSIFETERLIQSLKEQGIAVNNLLVNQVFPRNEPERFRARAVKDQSVSLREWNNVDDDALRVTYIPYQQEVIGLESLTGIAEKLCPDLKGDDPM